MWCVTLRLVVLRLPLREVASLLERIVVLVLLDSISDSLQGRLRRRHDWGFVEGVGSTSRSDGGGSDSQVALAGAESGSDSLSSSPDPTHLRHLAQRSKAETTDEVRGARSWVVLLLQLECCACFTSATHWRPIQ